jgi:hypothetical protein
VQENKLTLITSTFLFINYTNNKNTNQKINPIKIQVKKNMSCKNQIKDPRKEHPNQNVCMALGGN